MKLLTTVFVSTFAALFVSSVIACGSDSTNNRTVDDASVDPVPSPTTDPQNPPPVNDVDASVSVVDAGPTNQAECLAACEVKYPTAAAQSHQFDTSCMVGVCGSACDNLGQGKNFYPSVDAGASCDTNAAGAYPIGTPSQACSDCLATTQTCCKQWVDLFGSKNGQALNQCANTCWTTFSK